MIRRKTKERPFGATDERENVILSEACHSGAEGDRIKRSRRISICMLLTAFLSGCTDYAAKMEDDLEEWKAAQLDAEETQSSSSIMDESSSSEISESSGSIAPGTVDPSMVVIGTFTDSRDNQTYKSVTIGTQTWMAENLNYEAEESYCYNDDPANCATYGRLYIWAAATTACPSAWHLPSKAEFETLFSAVGGESIAGEKLKSTNGWNSSGNGTDAYAFSALPAGDRDYNENFNYEGYYAYFWSSTEINSNYAYLMYLDYDYGNAFLGGNDKDYGFSVRCLKDEGPTAESSSSKKNESSSSEASSSSSDTLLSSSSEISESSGSIALGTVDPSTVVIGTFTDSRDNQTYKSVTIGTQTWMAQNLNYEAENSFCYNVDPANCATYGRLYSWAAAMTACPSGWHLPSKEEFETLFTAVGGIGTAGEKLKSTNGWNSSGNGTDAYVFSALPAGYRSNVGIYGNEGNGVFFWSSTEDDSTFAYGMSLGYGYGNAGLVSNLKNFGFPVRCLKD